MINNLLARMKVSCEPNNETIATLAKKEVPSND